MTQKETGFKIVKFKGKAISVAICALFGGSVSSVAYAANTTIAEGETTAITAGNTPVFTGTTSGTASLATDVALVGDATTVTSGVGAITVTDGKVPTWTTGSLGTSSLP